METATSIESVNKMLQGDLLTFQK